MNIWIFFQYADPSIGYTRSADLGRRLAARGHRVTVFAAGFNHLTLRDDRLCHGEAWREEDFDGVTFVWISTPRYHINDWRRYANILVYSARAVWLGIRRRPGPDVTVGSSPHLLAPLAAWAVAMIRRARFVFEIRDLWPQVLVEMGGLREEGITTRALRLLERFLCRRATRIVSLLPRLDRYLAPLGVPAERITWVPNGVDTIRLGRCSPYRPRSGESLTVMYLGGMQDYNGLDVLLDAAETLQRRGTTDIRFVLVGDGTVRTHLMERAARLGLKNVVFRGVVPKTAVLKVLEEADVLFHGFRDLPVLRFGVSPTKISEYLWAGRPIIYAGAGANDPVAEAGAGITIPPAQPDALVAAIDALRAMTPERLTQMGECGPRYVSARLDMDVVAERFERAVSGD